jgi:hypothetical protein
MLNHRVLLLLGKSVVVADIMRNHVGVVTAVGR